MPGIIVGVDGSSDSLRALRWALSEAAAQHAPLTVLSVRDDREVTCTTGDLNQDQAAEDVQALVNSLPGGHHLSAGSGRSGRHSGRRVVPMSWGSYGMTTYLSLQPGTEPAPVRGGMVLDGEGDL